MGLGIDGTIIGDGIDFILFSADLRDCVGFGLLELLNELLHDIDEDDLVRRLVGTQFKGLLLDRVPRNRPGKAFLPRSHDQCSHHRNEQL